MFDPATEECDDGGDLELLDRCSVTCQVEDALLELQSWPDAEPRLKRFLGESPHPVAAGANAYAIAYVEEPRDVEAEPHVGLAIYGVPGPVVFDEPQIEDDPFGLYEISDGTYPVLFANPSTAYLSDDTFAVVFVDFGGDGDELGLALRKVDPADPLGNPLRYANASGAFSQYDPDILSLSDGRVVVAWTDNRNAFSGPDIFFRDFDEQLQPLHDVDFRLGDLDRAYTEQAEGRVRLAELGGQWAAAWRAGAPESWNGQSVVGRETIEVELEDGTHWTIVEAVSETSSAPFLPGAADDHPAVVAIDSRHLLVVYSIGTDPNGTGVANTSRLRMALLDADAPGEVVGLLVPEAMDEPATVSQSHPDAVVVGPPGPDQRLFVSWRSESTGTVFGDELRLKEAWVELAEPGDAHVFEVDGPAGPIQYALRFAPSRPLPRWNVGTLGDQRFAAFASVPYGPHHSLVAAWDDYGREHGQAQAQPDVVHTLSPLPLGERTQQRTDVCGTSPDELCGLGEGHCEGIEECESGLVCGDGLGPNYGLGAHVAVCVPQHCTNGVQDHPDDPTHIAHEDDVDCGGECGDCVGFCGNGVLEWMYGERCDDGNTVSGDGCRGDCRSEEICGDGIVDEHAGEVCDDGNTTGGDGCRADCAGTEQCGDGHLDTEAGEVCDDGNVLSGDGCRYDCLSAEVCGDGIVDGHVGELCDDGNADDTDDCPGSCRPYECGDGYVHTTEACDDAGASATCNANCTVSVCGDGIVNPVAGEECEAALDPDCDPDTCRYVQGCTDAASCLHVVSQSDTDPNNADIVAYLQVVNDGAEAIDLGQATIRYWFTGDCTSCSFSADCYWAQVGCGNVSRSFTSVEPPVRGADRYFEVGFGSSQLLQPGDLSGPIQLRIHEASWQALDESNDHSYLLATNYAPNENVTLYVGGELVWGIEPRVQAVCGDGIVDAGEACDDGGESDTCDADCTLAECTDGTLNTTAGELCDAGPDSADCNDLCKPSFCGDGVVNDAAGEVCDVALTPTCRQPDCDCYESGLGCTDGEVCLKVQSRPEGSATDGQIEPYVTLVNNGPVAVPLGELTMKYWFTADGKPLGELTTNCYYAQTVGCGGLVTSLIDVPAYSGADSVFELGFSVTDELAPGASIELKPAFHLPPDWPPFDETDDHSYQASSVYQDNTSITLYRNGELMWGIEPGPVPSCGNAVVEPPEVCDAGGDRSSCDADCTLPVCGDGHTNAQASEVCDDGNVTTETECPYGMLTCELCDATCSQVLSLGGSVCGDGTVDTESGEVCDDGNTTDEATCAYGTASCTGCAADCTTTLDLIGPYCGDAVITDDEACDDGNAQNETECPYGTASCTTCNADCSAALDLTGSYCGDGVLDSTEGEVCEPALESDCLLDCSGYEAPSTCTDSASCLHVEHWPGDDNPADDGNIQPYFKLVNNSAESVSLDTITIRYWFTEEPLTNASASDCTSGPELVTDCYWASFDQGSWTDLCSTDVTLTIHEVSPVRTGATHYLEVSFPATTWDLAAGYSTNELKLRVRKCDWSNFDETNDHSYSATSAYATTTVATVYQNGELTWGTEP